MGDARVVGWGLVLGRVGLLRAVLMLIVGIRAHRRCSIHSLGNSSGTRMLALDSLALLQPEALVRAG